MPNTRTESKNLDYEMHLRREFLDLSYCRNEVEDEGCFCPCRNKKIKIKNTKKKLANFI